MGWGGRGSWTQSWSVAILDVPAKAIPAISKTAHTEVPRHCYDPTQRYEHKFGPVLDDLVLQKSD